MGSFIELNDTLQITSEQGFPAELDLDLHVRKPIQLDSVSGRTFKFTDKSGVRNYQQPPVRVFLVQNIGGKWVYWGLINVTEVTHDYVAKITSGKYRITRLNSPQEMRQVFELTHGRAEMDYFA